nr:MULTISPECIES: SDR family oxidoreductase [Gordonia]
MDQDRAPATTPVDELLALPMLQAGRLSDGLHAYQVSKRANVLRVQAEAVRWGERGARVNAISPGIVITPLARDELNGANGAGYRRMIELAPAGRAGTPDEIGTVGELLMTERGAFITGSDVLIDRRRHRVVLLRLDLRPGPDPEGLTVTPENSTALIVGATGSIGRHAVSEALRQGYDVRALVRDRNGAERLLPDGVEFVVGDLARPDTLDAAVDDVDAIVFTHGSSTRESDVRDIDYAGVANVLAALAGRPVRIALMTAVGTTRPGVPYAAWKRRGERLVRASGNDYTIVRPGWFDYNDADQRRIVMRQGDTAQSGGPADGVIARDEIARVLVDSLSSDPANRKTLELAAERGAEQDDLAAVFAALRPDEPGALDGVLDTNTVPVDDEPARFRDDLSRIAGGSQ